MMNALVAEVQEWNTPTVGAYLLWKFTVGYTENHKDAKSPIVILHFIAATLLTKECFSNLISGKRRNLESYVRGFYDKKQMDVFAMLQQFIRDKMAYTLASIDIAVALGFLVWNVNTAEIYAVLSVRSKNGTAGLSSSVQALGKKATILGRWFSAKPISEIITLLGVQL